MSRELQLESKFQVNKTPVLGGGAVMVTPPIDEDYWTYRVMVSDTQAIVGFPKFGTIGIGFMVEDDWNTNLPYTCDTEEIFNHISHNKGDDTISSDDCRRAIDMIREEVLRDRSDN